MYKRIEETIYLTVNCGRTIRKVTEIGIKFINRIDDGFDPIEEMAMIHLAVGRYAELIGDIKEQQLK